MTGKFSRSWELARASASVLRSDKELLLFPLFSGVATLVVMATFLLPIMALRLFSDGFGIGAAVAGFLFYFVQYSVIVFFNCALVGAAMIRLDGGDPTLAVGEVSAYPGAARLDELAEQVRDALGSTTPTRVLVDSSLFPGPTAHPTWFAPDVAGGVISNITALMTDGARVNPTDRSSNAPRHPEPDLAAARLFAEALGVPPSQVGRTTAPPNAQVLGEVLSPPIARIVEMMLVDSDNVVAEMLARQVAVAKGLPASFDGAAQATRTVLAELQVPTPAGGGLVDGSGLSDANRVTTNQLVAVLHRAMSPDHPQLRVLLSGLPVAGYSGTLGERSGAGLGVVRAKTGTLSHVNALAGYVVDADGRMLAFAVVADATTNRWAAETALDRIAAQISRCGCR